MTQQQPNTFPVRNVISRAQPSNQFRPEDYSQKVPEDTKPFVQYTNRVFRQVFDLIQALRDAFGPTVLFASGSQTGAAITVPVQATQTKLGTGLGLQVSLTRPGTWIVSAAVNLVIAGDTDFFTLSLTVGASAVPYVAQYKTGANQTIMLCQNWQVTSETGDELLTLWIKKTSGAGTSNVVQANSTMSASWQGRST